MLVECKVCKGSGVAPGKTKPKYAKCKGRGEVEINRPIEPPKRVGR